MINRIKAFILTIFCLFLYISCGTFKTNKKESVNSSSLSELIACGDDKVVIYSRVGSDDNSLSKVWDWNPEISPDLPEDFRKYFRTIDECKPIGEDKILITASSSAVALVDRESKSTLFYAYVPMAHSAEYLPGGLIAVALSTADKGNALQLFDIEWPNRILFSDNLYSGHGVVWLSDLESIFALGFDVLREYKLQDWDTGNPSLKMVNQWKIPDKGGHDLYLTNHSKLLITTTNNVWKFDIGSSQFSVFEPLKDVKHVKSVNYNSDTGELVYTKAEISWWTHHVYFDNPLDTLTVKDINLYKVRTIYR